MPADTPEHVVQYGIAMHENIQYKQLIVQAAHAQRTNCTFYSNSARVTSHIPLTTDTINVTVYTNVIINQPRIMLLPHLKVHLTRQHLPHDDPQAGRCDV